MNALLVADIGGTNARFGLIEQITGQPGKSDYAIFAPQTLKCDDYSSFGHMVQAYCDSLDVPKPRYACLALAGPVKDNTIAMTNRKWHCSGDELASKLGFTTVKLLNDYAALACAAPHLTGEATTTLFEAQPDPQAPIAVLGPGTGFGIAAFIPDQYGGRVLPSEGGHVNFAPTTDTEVELLKFLLQEQQGYVSVEHLLSGSGLVKIYRALAHIAGGSCHYWQPDQISALGLSGEDSLCRETVQTFCNILGSVAGDKALEFYALGGVYIGGGITPRFNGFLQQTDFLTRFQSKGGLSEFVQRIPIHLVKTDNAALIGCAAWLQNFIPN